MYKKKTKINRTRKFTTEIFTRFTHENAATAAVTRARAHTHVKFNRCGILDEVGLTSQQRVTRARICDARTTYCNGRIIAQKGLHGTTAGEICRKSVLSRAAFRDGTLRACRVPPAAALLVVLRRRYTSRRRRPVSARRNAVSARCSRRTQSRAPLPCEYSIYPPNYVTIRLPSPTHTRR